MRSFFLSCLIVGFGWSIAVGGWDYRKELHKAVDHAGRDLSNTAKQIASGAAKQSHELQHEIAPAVADAKVKIHLEADHLADNFGKGSAQVDQGRIGVMTDPQMIDLAMTAAGGYFGNAQGALTGHIASQSFSDGVNGRRRQNARDSGGNSQYQDDGNGGGGSSNGSGGSDGSSGDVSMTIEQYKELQAQRQKDWMDRMTKQEEIFKQQQPFLEQNARRQHDLQQTQQIIQGVGGIIQMLSQ